MNIISLLGKLPASTSDYRSLNNLDLVKTLRTWIVALVATFFVAAGTSVLSVCNLQACNLEAGILSILEAALTAGVLATVTAGGELVRRYFSSAFVSEAVKEEVKP